ncbi:hypothetical protein [Sodalis glossinidius]|nr:hypothetical protein [Sodalis glossinidius]
MTLDRAHVTGNATSGELIAAVHQAGYQARQTEAAAAPKLRR